MYVSQPKKNLSCFSLLLHILCLTAKEKSPYFSLLSHTLIIYLEGGNTFFFFFFHIALFGYLLVGGNTLLFRPWLVFLKLATFVLSSLAYLFQGRNTLLSPPWLLDPWAKAIKFIVTLSIYKTLFLFLLELGIHYLFNNE